MANDPRDPLLGAPVLGGYVITALLGAGGMGSVYVAEHQRINKKVAIKVLHPHMSSNRDIVQRFLAEARAASALDHPNIIEVIDAATLDDGRDYIALEFLDGDALDDYLRARTQLELGPALHILAQTCCGLEAAHHLGIVHRDLKPANLFIAPTELDPLRTKILDFGIAKLTDTVMAGGIETGTDAIAGTPGYMAPEQARGMRDVDHRADIYALGAVAYRMMSGATPYTGESLGEIIYQQMSAPPPSVSSKRADLPAGWVQAIMSCLGAEPGMRPPSARHLALDLASATPGGVAIIRAAAPLLFSDAWIERNRALTAGLPQPARAAQLAVGATATYQPGSARSATPATTLSSAVGSISPAPPMATKKRWPLVVAAAGVSIATVAVIASIGAIGGPDSKQAAAASDAAPVVTVDAQATVTRATDTTPDAGSFAEAIRPPGARVTITVELDPADAVIELDGVVTRSPLELARDSSHQLVVRRAGYRTERRELRASTDGIIPIELARAGGKTRPPTAKATETAKTTTAADTAIKKPKTTKGPISTSLEEAQPKVGPTSDKL